MLNAARTYLIGLDGVGVELDPFGLYSPVGYRAVALPAPLRAVADALYNGSADRALRNYFAHLYLTILHAGDYADHLLLDDDRLTYAVPFDAAALPDFGAYTAALPATAAAPPPDPPAAEGAGPLAWNPARRRERAAWRRAMAAPPPAGGGGTPPPATLYLSGARPAGPGRRRLVDTWTVAVADAATVTVRPAGGAAPAAVALSFADGLSAPFPLAGSPMMGRIPQHLDAGTAWAVAALVQPAEGVPEVLARLDGLHADSLVALFGAAPAGVDATYEALFRDHDQAPERLTGALLALIRRTAELSTSP